MSAIIQIDASARAQEPAALTARQVHVYLLVTRYYEAVGDGCPASHVARRLGIHPEAARSHFATLCRKGWLVSDTSPAVPRRPFLVRER